MKSFQSQQGAIYLTVAVMVTLLLAAIIFVIQLMTLFSVHFSRTQAAEKVTYYASEGVLHDTISRAYYSYFTWPTINPNETQVFDPPQIPGLTMTRTISRDADNLYTIDITAASRQATRRLVAKVANPYQSPPAIDIALVMDVSFSMDDQGCISGNVGCEPITSAKNAMVAFMEKIDANPLAQNIQTALVSYGDVAMLKLSLTSDVGDVKNRIEALRLNGNTNIHHALQLAQMELLASGNPNSRKFILLLTDGIPNRFSNPPIDCDGYPSIVNQCISEALTMASTVKSNNITIYTIGLGLSSPHDYIQQPQIDLAHYVLDTIATSPASEYARYAPSLTDLDQLYSNILDQILLNSSFSVQEVAAGEPIL